jgi:hypothetical protein
MKKLIVLSLLFATAAYAGTARFTHETVGNGMTKQCHYRYLNESYSITVNRTKLCPLTIQV